MCKHTNIKKYYQLLASHQTQEEMSLYQNQDFIKTFNSQVFGRAGAGAPRRAKGGGLVTSLRGDQEIRWAVKNIFHVSMVMLVVVVDGDDHDDGACDQPQCGD